MSRNSTTAEVNIHLRARAEDRDLIDSAAGVVGANRSQFMLSSAIKEAKSVLLDQTLILMNGPDFEKTLDWLDGPASVEEADGVRRLLAAAPVWQHD